MLREAVAMLAAPPNEQVDYLDFIFASCTGGGSAAGYGNYELAYDLEDAFLATDDMLSFGEVSANEIAATKSLNDHLLRYWEIEDATFWRRGSLFDDARWREIRALAKIVLHQLPNEKRESEYTRSVKR